MKILSVIYKFLPKKGHSTKLFFKKGYKILPNMNIIDAAVHNTVNSAIAVVDVDGVVRKIDVNNVVERIDVNAVLDRVDWNHVIQKIDIDSTIIQRIDMDALMKRIDTRSIIVSSSTGIFSTFMDAMRTNIVIFDLYLWVVSRCKHWCHHTRQHCYLPPKPPTQHYHGTDYRQRNDRQLYPKGRTNKAVAVQGRYCGFVSKTIAIMIDVFTVTILFSLLFQVIQWFLVIFFNQTHEKASEATKGFQQDQAFLVLILYCIYWFLYFFLSVALTGMTFGMLLVGVRVVNCQKSSPHKSVSVQQAFFRTCLLPVTLTVCWPLGVIGLYRRDGRMLHDLIAQTGMIYLWDAKMAKERRQVMQQDNAAGSSFVSNDDDSDPLDAYIDEDLNNTDDDEESPFIDDATNYTTFPRTTTNS
jgi:uncharacterized RDD family membrane protein YckC